MLYALYTGLACVAIYLFKQPGAIAAVWWSNAVAVLYLLATPGKAWPLYLGVATLGVLSANTLGGDSLGKALVFVPGNLVQIILAASILRAWGRTRDAMLSATQFVLLLLLGAALPAAGSATVGAAALALAFAAPYESVWISWFAGELLGSVTILPLGLVLLHHGPRWLGSRVSSPYLVSALLAALALTLLIPGRVAYPFITLAVPLILIAVLGRFPGAAVATGLCSIALTAMIAFGQLLPPPTPALYGGELQLLITIALLFIPPLMLGASLDQLNLLAQQLARSEQEFRTLYERTPAIMHSIDRDGRLLRVSDLWLQKMGYLREEVIGRLSTDFLTPESRRRAIETVLPRLFHEGRIDDVEYQWQTRDGRILDIRVSVVLEWSGDNAAVRSLSVIQDVTEEKRLERELAQEQERILVTLKSIGDGVICTDARGNVTFLNPVAEATVAWTNEEAIGRPFAEVVRLFEAGTNKPLLNPVESCLANGKTMGLPESAVLISRSGLEYGVQDSVAPIIGNDATLLGTVMVFQDVTESRALTQRMSYLAHHDVLTNLPNRVLLQDRIFQACQYGRRHETRFAVVFMDLDHFKQINDSLGHAAGDELLKAVAQRLTNSLRSSDSVSRLGGDEFVMLIEEVKTKDALSEVARKILRDVARPLTLCGTEVSVGISLGFAIFPDDGEEPDALMKHADAAMYRAKREGRNAYRFYAQDHDEVSPQSLQFESDLRRSVEQRTLQLFYQPQIDAVSLQPRAVEALVRWDRPGYGLVSPEDFIPLAEERGLIFDLGRCVLEQACAQWRSWQATVAAPLRVAVNVSPLQLTQPGFVELVQEQIESQNLIPGSLEVEITETAFMKNTQKVQAVLRSLKALGVRIVVDDFGTGYSSLSHLKYYPIDAVKIDRSFVRDMESDQSDRNIVRAIIAMAKALHLETVAEGVETEGQIGLLQDYGCDLLQGYAFARPFPASSLLTWTVNRGQLAPT